MVLTGGPGAGKTAVLEVVRQNFCEHVVIVPEAASIVLSGGFPPPVDAQARRAVQRAIFFVQRELERALVERGGAAMILCDRGTVDGVAYWPDPPETFWADVGTTAEAERVRYAAVIHLRTPSIEHGYDHSNPVRTETPEEAGRLDDLLAEAWDGHPRREFVADAPIFLEKLRAAVALIRAELPICCRRAPSAA